MRPTIQSRKNARRPDTIDERLADVIERIGQIEGTVASVSRRVDRIDLCMDRIERRLDLVDAPAS